VNNQDKSVHEIMDTMSTEQQDALFEETEAKMIESFQIHLDSLEDDDPFKKFAFYYLQLEELGEDEDPPKLFGTVPMWREAIEKKLGGEIPVLTTVQITAMSYFGEVLINTNLGETNAHQAQVFHQSITDYRDKAVKIDVRPEE
jgi:hypothetical protein